MTTSYTDDTDDGLTQACKGLTESYVDGTMHEPTLGMWGWGVINIQALA